MRRVETCSLESTRKIIDKNWYHLEAPVNVHVNKQRAEEC